MGLPFHHHKAKPPESVREEEAAPKYDEDFAADMAAAGLVATDGAGGARVTASSRHRSVGAGAAVLTFDIEGNATKESLMIAKVPGNQTVPRAES